MPIIAIIALLGVAIFVVYMLLSKNEVTLEREGVVRNILKKDAITVEFDDGRPSVVRFFGISLATDAEMLDEKIATFMDDGLLGARVMVKPRQVGTGDVIVGEVRTQIGEYINALLVRQGFARWSPSEGATDAALMEAQELAKQEQLGVWNPAIRQLAEERMRAASAEGMSDDDIANLTVDPEEEETK